LGGQEVMRTLGIEIARLELGEITLTMPYAAAYTQQHGFVHAGHRAR
jgi:acyl-coenzyme A thioesterase PaaI-like protein